MKKLFAFCFVILLACPSAVPCFAQIAEVPGAQDIPVFATYTENIPGLLQKKLENGTASVTTEDGITITTSDVVGDKLTLVVMPITKDTEGYDWFLSCMKDTGTKILPFDIYFTDEFGNRVSPTGERKITITLPGSYEVPVVCYIAQDGKVTVLASSVKNGEIGFYTNHNSFYVVAEKKSTGGPPQTGDNSNIWLSLLVISGAVLTGSIVSAKHKKTKE